MIALVRVDNRLIHGQVVEAWLPHLHAERVAVADDEAAQSPLVRAAMGLAVQPQVEVVIEPLSKVPFGNLGADPRRTLILLRDVRQVLQAKAQGLSLGHLNLGNVHYQSGRVQVSPSVFLSPEELDQLKMLASEGVEVEARGVPTDRPVTLSEMAEKLGKGA